MMLSTIFCEMFVQVLWPFKNWVLCLSVMDLGVFKNYIFWIHIPCQIYVIWILLVFGLLFQFPSNLFWWARSFILFFPSMLYVFCVLSKKSLLILGYRNILLCFFLEALFTFCFMIHLRFLCVVWGTSKGSFPHLMFIQLFWHYLFDRLPHWIAFVPLLRVNCLFKSVSA